MLEPIKNFNDLSPELRSKLENRVKSFGKTVTYKFYVDKEHPDPQEKAKGVKIYPQIFTLTPGTFTIIDKSEKREGKPQLKYIGAIAGPLDRDGNPEGFLKLKVHGVQNGQLTLDLETREGQDLAMLAELHPKHDGGLFADPKVVKIFRRIDEVAESKSRVHSRKTRTEALLAATTMSEKEMRDLAISLADVDENSPIEVVKDAVESYAENFSEDFVKLVNSGTWGIKATVKKAFDRQILIYIPMENKVIWSDSQKVLCHLPSVEAGTIKSHYDLLTDWLLSAKDGEKTISALKALTK